MLSRHPPRPSPSSSDHVSAPNPEDLRVLEQSSPLESIATSSVVDIQPVEHVSQSAQFSPGLRPITLGTTTRDLLVDEADTSYTYRATVESGSSLPEPLSSSSSQTPVLLPPRSNPFSSNLNRDTLLAYAYHLYAVAGQPPYGMSVLPSVDSLPVHPVAEGAYKLQLLPLLTTLRALHPHDTAVLLLMACTYYALADFDASLSASLEILKINPNSAEAMSNIGTTMKAMGRNDHAYEWWWKALQIRPTNWDAMDNLFGFLLSAAQSSQDPEDGAVLHARALDVCTFVQGRIVGEGGRLCVQVSMDELHRLQKVYFTSATLRIMQPDGVQAAVQDYFRGIELVIRSPPPYEDNGSYTMRDLILATFIAGYLISSATDSPVPTVLLESLGKPAGITVGAMLSSGFDIFHAVRVSGDRLIQALLHVGNNALPFLLLVPEHVSCLPMLLFPGSGGILPGICSRSTQGRILQRPSDSTIRQTNQMSSTLLLALAKRYQDLPVSSAAIPGFQDTLNINHSLAIMLYYLALSLNPCPSTYNNMGIILSATASVGSYNAGQAGERISLSGSALARIYYDAGLQLDPSHPHLLTNLGSLYKDHGDLEEAIRLYLRAIAIKPDFDIALANLGNAVKDMGRAWEAIGYYRRAVDLNPDLPEAVCGLVSSMASICDWRGRDALNDGFEVGELGDIIPLGDTGDMQRLGYMKKMRSICEAQLDMAYYHNVHCVRASETSEDWIKYLEPAIGRLLHDEERRRWTVLIDMFYGHVDHVQRLINEGGFIIRLIDWLQPRLQHRWYIKAYGKICSSRKDLITDSQVYQHLFLRPSLPKTMTPPVVPSILPFNTFTYPLSARMIRLIAHRNALCISFVALSQLWLPQHVYPPPAPPFNGVLNIGYVSNDVNNHPLAHLMLSVFGFHDKNRFKVFLYTTSPWDGSSYRPKISKDVNVFIDASTWSSQQIVEHTVQNKIHILINLGGYTKGSRNDVFAARPCPVQMQLMGYAGTLGAGWCDYLVCDPISCPQDLCATELWRKRREQNVGSDIPLDLDADLDPEELTDDWVFSEKFIYMPHTFMVTDHKQSFRTDENLSPEERAHTPVGTLWRNEELRRMKMRGDIFPNLPCNTVIFANFNQLYKIDPTIYAVWLRILARVPNSILWLLRFPPAGEEHLLRSATMWAGAEVASRIRFTDVAQKDVHVHRSRVADLFLDTVECNAHTIAADVLWPGTPIITFPKHRYKMCSRVAASMVNATGFGSQMVVHSLREYEDRAVALAQNLIYTIIDGEDGSPIIQGEGELMDLRRNIFLNRDRMPLFDTVRWTRNVEKAYQEAWRRWVEGTQFELSDEWEACTGPEKQSGCIWVTDEDPVDIVHYERFKLT